MAYQSQMQVVAGATLAVTLVDRRLATRSLERPTGRLQTRDHFLEAKLEKQLRGKLSMADTKTKASGSVSVKLAIAAQAKWHRRDRAR